MSNPNVQFAHFYLSQMAADWDVLKSSVDSQDLLHWLHFTNSLKASWLRSDEYSSLGSSFNDLLSEQNFEN